MRIATRIAFLLVCLFNCKVQNKPSDLKTAAQALDAREIATKLITGKVFEVSYERLAAQKKMLNDINGDKNGYAERLKDNLKLIQKSVNTLTWISPSNEYVAEDLSAAMALNAANVNAAQTEDNNMIHPPMLILKNPPSIMNEQGEVNAADATTSNSTNIEPLYSVMSALERALKCQTEVPPDAQDQLNFPDASMGYLERRRQNPNCSNFTGDNFATDVAYYTENTLARMTCLSNRPDTIRSLEMPRILFQHDYEENDGDFFNKIDAAASDLLREPMFYAGRQFDPWAFDPDNGVQLSSCSTRSWYRTFNSSQILFPPTWGTVTGSNFIGHDLNFMIVKLDHLYLYNRGRYDDILNRLRSNLNKAIPFIEQTYESNIAFIEDATSPHSGYSLLNTTSHDRDGSCDDNWFQNLFNHIRYGDINNTVLHQILNDQEIDLISDHNTHKIRDIYLDNAFVQLENVTNCAIAKLDAASNDWNQMVEVAKELTSSNQLFYEAMSRVVHKSTSTELSFVFGYNGDYTNVDEWFNREHHGSFQDVFLQYHEDKANERQRTHRFIIGTALVGGVLSAAIAGPLAPILGGAAAYTSAGVMLALDLGTLYLYYRRGNDFLKNDIKYAMINAALYPTRDNLVQLQNTRKEYYRNALDTYATGASALIGQAILLVQARHLYSGRVKALFRQVHHNGFLHRAQAFEDQTYFYGRNIPELVPYHMEERRSKIGRATTRAINQIVKEIFTVATVATDKFNLKDMMHRLSVLSNSQPGGSLSNLLDYVKREFGDRITYGLADLSQLQRGALGAFLINTEKPGHYGVFLQIGNGLLEDVHESILIFTHELVHSLSYAEHLNKVKERFQDAILWSTSEGYQTLLHKVEQDLILDYLEAYEIPGYIPESPFHTIVLSHKDYIDNYVILKEELRAYYFEGYLYHKYGFSGLLTDDAKNRFGLAIGAFDEHLNPANAKERVKHILTTMDVEKFPDSHTFIREIFTDFNYPQHLLHAVESQEWLEYSLKAPQYFDPNNKRMGPSPQDLLSISAPLTPSITHFTQSVYGPKTHYEVADGKIEEKCRRDIDGDGLWDASHCLTPGWNVDPLNLRDRYDVDTGHSCGICIQPKFPAFNSENYGVDSIDSVILIPGGLVRIPVHLRRDSNIGNIKYTIENLDEDTNINFVGTAAVIPSSSSDSEAPARTSEHQVTYEGLNITIKDQGDTVDPNVLAAQVNAPDWLKVKRRDNHIYQDFSLYIDASKFDFAHGVKSHTVRVDFKKYNNEVLTSKFFNVYVEKKEATDHVYLPIIINK